MVYIIGIIYIHVLFNNFSEYNHSLSNEVHFLQIWCKPNKKNLKPSYITKSFTDQEKLNKLCHIISPKVNIYLIIKNTNISLGRKF